MDTVLTKERQTVTIDEARQFRIEELFFSITDRKGHILNANEVFIRVSNFSSTELRNKPHNIIRHPEMPRAIFQLLWEYLEGGRSIVAYVKNRARDGRYYWVMALVSPSADGYVSVRFKPSSELFTTVQTLYRELKEIELPIEDGADGKKAAIEASRAALDVKVRALGFATYDDFMREAFRREMRSRDEMLRRAGPTDSSENRRAVGVTRRYAHALESLNILFGELDSYVKINEGIRLKCELVTSLSESIRILSINGVVESEALGATAVGTAKVLDWLQHFSNEIGQRCQLLSKPLAEVIAEVNRVLFELTAAKLEVEMSMLFVNELAKRGKASEESHDEMNDGAAETLHASCSRTVQGALEAISTLKNKLRKLGNAQADLAGSARSLRLIYFKGIIEIASVASAQLGIIFEQVKDRLSQAEENLDSLDNLVRQLQASLSNDWDRANVVTESLARAD